MPLGYASFCHDNGDRAKLLIPLLTAAIEEVKRMGEPVDDVQKHFSELIKCAAELVRGDKLTSYFACDHKRKAPAWLFRSIYNDHANLAKIGMRVKNAADAIRPYLRTPQSVSDELVERVAKAICKHQAKERGEDNVGLVVRREWQSYTGEAKAAIAAMSEEA